MKYSKLLTQTPTEELIERIDWYNFADPDLVWEFNCLMTLHEISTCPKRDIDDAIQLVAVGYRTPNKAKLTGRVLFIPNIDGAAPTTTFPTLAGILVDITHLPIPAEFNDWEISISTDRKYNYAIATKDLNNGLLCVNIALFGKLR